MAILSCDEIDEGMVLARPVVSPQGQLLAPAKTAMTARHVRLFKMWGVTQVEIEGGDEPAATPVVVLSTAERAVTEQAVAQRFAGSLNHPVMIEIARVAIRLALSREAERRLPPPDDPAAPTTEGDAAAAALARAGDGQHGRA